ncbi:MAG TPA: STAS domain-containing protein [Planctomycetaceae bacterium]|nr:STAS domain-containing protein [Planctomycetaceae bacterium]
MPNQPVPQISRQDGVTVIELGPEFENLDEHALETLREAVLEAAQHADPPRLVLDLSHTKFFGSAFIELLFRAFSRVNEHEGGIFALSGLTEYCAEVITVTHLDRLWQIHPTRDAAVKALSGS